MHASRWYHVCEAVRATAATACVARTSVDRGCMVWRGVACLQSADFGPKTALRLVDTIRDGVKSGKVKTGADIRTALKARSTKTALRDTKCTYNDMLFNHAHCATVYGVAACVHGLMAA